jgi:hypothetical protein
MCDFSLEHLASRPAKVGDQLVTTKFGRAYTTGLCAVGQPSVAVCIKPGTELAFDREIGSNCLNCDIARARERRRVKQTGFLRFRLVGQAEGHRDHRGHQLLGRPMLPMTPMPSVAAQSS